MDNLIGYPLKDALDILKKENKIINISKNVILNQDLHSQKELL